MSQVNTNSIYDASGGSAAKLYGVSMRNGGTAWVNRIINGDMRIDQRNAGASVATSSGSSVFTVDRWTAGYTQTSKFTAQQNAGSVTPPASFTNYLGATSSSAYSVLTGDAFWLNQRVEGLNVADLGWGTANAQTVTVSFWVRSSLTGTFGGSVFNSAPANRSYPFTYTISAANTWELKTITIPGDTTGTWLTTTGTGLQINFALGAGSTFSGTAGAWAGSAFYTATGATSVVGTSGATFYITGVQLEAGTVASPFERRDYGRELLMAQRYYTRFFGDGAGQSGIATGFQTSTTAAVFNLQLPAQMRSEPTATAASLTSSDQVSFDTPATLSSVNASQQSANVSFATAAVGVAFRPVTLFTQGSTSGFLAFSSEL